MVSLELLKSTEIFKGLDDEQIITIQGYCEELEFQQEEKLFAEGDKAVQVWIVCEGRVDLRFELPGKTETSKEYNVSSIEAKPSETKILGWSCFVPPYKMRLSAYCNSRHCKVVRIEKDKLLELFENDTEMGYQVLTYLITVVGYRFQQFQDAFVKDIGEELISGW